MSNTGAVERHRFFFCALISVVGSGLESARCWCRRYDLKQFDSSVEGITNKIVVTMFVNVIPTEWEAAGHRTATEK